MRHDPTIDTVRGRPGDWRKWDGRRWVRAQLMWCSGCGDGRVVAEWERQSSGEWTCEPCLEAEIRELVRRRLEAAR